MTMMITPLDEKDLALFQPKEERTIERGCLVGVHWNSHRNMWSIVGMKSRKSIGVVLGYCEEITLQDVTFHIEKSKQTKVREYGAKDRHAFVVGKLVNFTFEDMDGELYYNPFKVDNFVCKSDYKHKESVEAVSLKFEQKPIVKYGSLKLL